MVNDRTNNAKDIISALRSGIGTVVRVFDTEIPSSVRVAESSLEGISTVSYTHLYKADDVAGAVSGINTKRTDPAYDGIGSRVLYWS